MEDASNRRIRGGTILLGCILAFCFTAGSGGEGVPAAVVVYGSTLYLRSRGRMGGGDVKMLPLYILLLGENGFLQRLAVMWVLCLVSSPLRVRGEKIPLLAYFFCADMLCLAC